MRSEFSETAFWQPHLLTAADGSATFEFTVPDSVTSWNVWVHALTRDLRGGSLHKETRSVKDLMVRPYVPRFLREGDRAQLKVVVNNAGEQPLSGTLVFDIVDPATDRSLLHEFGLASDASRPFTVKPGGSADLVFPIVAPARVGQVAFKVTARAGDLSDGELRPLPILPGRMHLVESRFVTLRPGKPRTMSFPDLARGDDPTLVNEQMVVSVDAQLFYGVLQALPYLIDYPYECTEQTLNRFLSTAILSGMFQQYPAVAKMAAEMAKRETRLETWAETDPNRKMALEETPWLQEARGGADPGLPLLKVLDPRIAKAQREASLAKLRKMQTSLGAFPWWPGGPPSPYMTLYVVYGFAKGLEFGVEAPKDTVTQGLGLPAPALPRRGRARHAQGRLLLGVRDLRQLRALELPRRVLDGRRLHGRRAQGDARLLVPALEGALALSQGPARPHPLARRPQGGRAPRLRQRHGLGEDRGGPGHLLGPRGPRLALVQRHDREPRLRAARPLRAASRATRGATASCSGCS